MPDPFFDKFIADLVKGAEQNSRANGGPGVNIIVSRGNTGHEEKLASHAGPGALNQRYAEGVKAAAEALGVKEAFLSLLGSVAGPALARAGVGALGRGAAGKALSGVAGKVAPHITGGLGGAAFDQAVSMAGGALGDKMQRPQGIG